MILWLMLGLEPACVCLRFCVYSGCLQPGQRHSKPWVCHSQCQVSQHDADTQRGLRRATDPPPTPPALPQVKGQPVPSIPPDEEVFPSLLTLFWPTCSWTVVSGPQKGASIGFCMLIDPVGV